MTAHTSLGDHPRVFHEGEHDLYINAGYHTQEWGPLPHDAHELIGTYSTPDGTITVRVIDGASGHPEFELTWNENGEEHGGKVTVLDEATALAYLIPAGAVEVTP